MKNNNLDFDNFFEFGKPVNEYSIKEDDKKNTILCVNVMGLPPDTIDVNIDGHNLTIYSENLDDDSDLIKNVNLSFTISDNLSTSPTSAEVKNGLLTIVFEPETTTVKTAIKLKF